MNRINVRRSASTVVLLSFVLILTYEKKAKGEIPPPEVAKQIVQTVRDINQAFIRGDLKTLQSLTHKELTMLHGHMKRIENQEQALEEWKGLFSARAGSGISYFIKESDFKVQLYGDVAVVTFNYEHPIVVRGKVGTEGGKAVYVLIREEQRWPMVHCSTIRNVTDRVIRPIP